jgi:predicted cupin superfamily sugar epimerase
LAKTLTAAEVIRLLELRPHPEGGHFRETLRDRTGTKACAIRLRLFLLAAGERSHWHKVDAMESGTLRWCATPLEIASSARAGRQIRSVPTRRRTASQAAVAHARWRPKARQWTLVGCAVAPGLISRRIGGEGLVAS